MVGDEPIDTTVKARLVKHSSGGHALEDALYACERNLADCKQVRVGYEGRSRSRTFGAGNDALESLDILENSALGSWAMDDHATYLHVDLDAPPILRAQDEADERAKLVCHGNSIWYSILFASPQPQTSGV
jgi:hypothetical protein